MDLRYGLAMSLAYVFLGVVVLLASKIIRDLLTPFKIDDQLTTRDNPALGVALTGYFAGVVIIFLGAVVGPVEEEAPTLTDRLAGMGVDLLYALGGIIALNLGRLVVDRLVLPKFSTTKEIITDRNVGTGAVVGGAFVATALIVAGAVHGEGGGILTTLVFFALGQLVLVLFSAFYQWITRYDVHDEIERDNVAAGTALGVSMIAIGIILLRATAGDFVGWTENLTEFGFAAGIGFVLLLVLRKITDWVLLPGTTIDHEIANDRNLNAAWIEGVVAMGMATIIFFML